MANKTLCIIKPDALKNGYAESIINKLIEEKFRISNRKDLQLTKAQAEEFYMEHQGKDFFPHLIKFMTSELCMILCLEREDAIQYLRNVIGATNPKEAEAGTIRNLYGSSMPQNAVHASDSEES